MTKYHVQVADDHHIRFTPEICSLIEESAKQRGTGIARRSPEYVEQKIREKKAIIAISSSNELVGFCYIESWSNKHYVPNSGLIINPAFRGRGVGARVKKKAFDHSRKMFPTAKLFGLTTSLPVMKINSDLGYVPVTYDNLTQDEAFWSGCQSCVNYKVLMSKEKHNCLCTAMLYSPKSKSSKRWNFIKKSRLYERYMNIKRNRLLRKQTKSNFSRLKLIGL